MDPLAEMKAGLWNSEFVVLIGACTKKGAYWIVARDPDETGTWIRVHERFVLAAPEPLDYPPSGYDGKAVEGLRVALGAEITVMFARKEWTTRITFTNDMTIAIGQPPKGTSLCISNLLFTSRSKKVQGVCFGKWNPETPGPQPRRKRPVRAK